MTLLSKLEFDARIGPSAIMGALNFLALAFTAGMIWQDYNGKGERRDESITQLQREVVDLRNQHVAIAVLQTDVGYIKDSSARVEAMVLSIIREKRAGSPPTNYSQR